jgi:hypothetical protein
VMVKGQPKTDLPAALPACRHATADRCDSTAQAGELIPLAALKESINKAAYAYTGKWLGPKEEVGNLPAPPACRRATADRRYRLARQAGPTASAPSSRRKPPSPGPVPARATR